MSKKQDLVEIFGHAPDDLTAEVRRLWQQGRCPFTHRECIKFNHDKSITYGTCAVTSSYGDTIICPNRLYADNYTIIRRVAADAFGQQTPFYMFNDYDKSQPEAGPLVVALGKHSGKEVRVGKVFSMDWVLALLQEGRLTEYVGIEVQSLDITGNYRDAWHSYHTLSHSPRSTQIAPSKHGLNWANVHKRLIPQLIRKGTVYASSQYVQKGIYFIVPDIVYRKFEELIGDIPKIATAQKDTITVFTYTLGQPVPQGAIRSLVPVRTLRFRLADFAVRFIQGPNLPTGQVLDSAVYKMLDIGGTQEEPG